ncbi:MAG: response regulator [Rhodomicrobium sp.]
MSYERQIYIVDDDKDFRCSLECLLRAAEYNVVAFDSAPGFLDSLSGLGHGCILLDVKMPTMSGLELQKRLNETDSVFPVVVISAQGDVQTAVEAMKEGAADFIEKPFEPSRLFTALEDAIALVPQARHRAEAGAAARRIAALSPREGQVLDALANGMTAKRIAHALGISIRTVEVHRSRMLDRLGVDKVIEAVKLLVLATEIRAHKQPGRMWH